MDAAERARLERECDVLARHLMGAAPPEPARATYLRAHALGCVAPPRGETRFDRLLVGLARGGPRRARMADAYAAVLARDSLLRRKLVLLLALLESGAATSARIDRPTPGASAAVALRACGMAAGFALCFAAGALVLTPLRAGCALLGPRRGAR